MKYRYVKYNTFSNKFLFYFHIIPIHTRSHASSESVKIARGSDFAELFIDELFIDELLTELINDGTDYHWLFLQISISEKGFILNQIRLKDSVYLKSAINPPFNYYLHTFLSNDGSFIIFNKLW